MKSVFSYSNYRLFLSDWYIEKKDSPSSYSYKRFSEAASLNSPNYLALIIKGKRDLTIHNIHQFGRALGFRFDELEYFEVLVMKNQSKSKDESSFYLKKIKNLKKNRPKKAIKKLPDAAISEWFSMAVLTLSHKKSFSEAVKKTQKEIGLDKTIIEKTIRQLMTSGLLKEDKESILQIYSQQTTVHDPKGLSKRQEQYLYSQVQQSLKAFDKTYFSGKGKFLSHSFTVPPYSISEVQDRLLSFLEELTNEMDERISTEEHLLQINIQTFHPFLWD